MRAAQPSLIRRIFWRLTFISVVAVALAYGLLLLHYVNTRDTLRDRSLRGQAEDVADAVRLGPDGLIRLDLPQELLDSYRQSTGRYGFTVLDERSRVLFAMPDPPLVKPPLGPADVSGISYFRVDGPGTNDGFYGAMMRIDVGGRLAWVTVVQDQGHSDILVDTIVEEFFNQGFWLILAFLALLLVVTLTTVRQTLSPLQRLSARAAAINPMAADIRLPERDVPTEVLPLVRAINGALARLEQGFITQREFTADVAHQLRTPLAVLEANIDTMADRAGADSLKPDVLAMNRLVSQLLSVARLDHLLVAPEESTDLHCIAVEVAAFLAPLALAEDKTLEVTGSDGPLRARGSAEALTHALRNLVENAIQYTPPGGAIEIALADGPVVRVSDTGPGVPADQRVAIFRRFWRADQRRQGGAGLGLAIVARTMAAHGGTVEVNDRPGGGAVFELRFLPASGPSVPGRS
jgi:signal transduction histidine kinase